jgi:hypothetical protein
VPAGYPTYHTLFLTRAGIGYWKLEADCLDADHGGPEVRSYVILFSACSLFVARPGLATNRLNLPQLSAEVTLNADEVKGVFTAQQGKGEVVLAPPITQLLIGSLPAEFRDGCREMVPNFGPQAAAKTTWAWSIRRLYIEGNENEQSTLLALRCTAHVPEITYFDERLAVLLNGKKTVLKLLALDRDCTDCSTLYHLQFTQRFDSDSGYLAELNIDHTTENPCCDGGYTETGSGLLLIAVPSGVSALALDKDTHSDVPGEESSDSHSDCKSVITYERDGMSKLRAVVSSTTCTENGKVQPSITTSRYDWDRSKRRFEKTPNTSTPKAQN